MIDDEGDRKIVRGVGGRGIERWNDVERWGEIGGSMGMKIEEWRMKWVREY